MSFVSTIATRYRAARGGEGPKFFFANGTCMTSVFAPSVALAATQLAAKGVDATIIDLTLPGGAHCDCGHPSEFNHIAMAQRALPIIQQALGWDY